MRSAQGLVCSASGQRKAARGPFPIDLDDFLMRRCRVLMRQPSTLRSTGGTIVHDMGDITAIMILAIGFGAAYGALACLAALMPKLEDRS